MKSPPWRTVRELVRATDNVEEEKRELGELERGEIRPADWTLFDWEAALQGIDNEALGVSVEGLLLESDACAFVDDVTLSTELVGVLFADAPALESCAGQLLPVEPVFEGVGQQQCANQSMGIIDLTASDDESEDDVRRPRRRRLRRLDEHFDDVHLEEEEEVPDRPLLPEPPAVHPATGAQNMYDPSEPLDTDRHFDVFAVMDRALDLPHRAYLVQWWDAEHRFIASWVWASSLQRDGFDDDMERIDKWKDQYPWLTYQQFCERFPTTYTASTTGQCFFDAVKLACVIFGDHELVTAHQIEQFITENAIDASQGAATADIRRFVGFLRKHRSAMAINVFAKNLLSKSLNNVDDLDNYPLETGVYVVGAACARNIRHCFVMKVSGGARGRHVYDDLDQGGNNDEYSKELLDNLHWIRRVGFIRKVERVGNVKKTKKPLLA